MATTTIQPGAQETFIDKNSPTTNYHNDVDGLELWDKFDPIQTRRILISFTLPDLGAVTINSVTLSLYYYYKHPSYQDPNGKQTNIYTQPHTDWVDTEATWNIYKSGSNWTSAGGDYNLTPTNQTAFPASYGWMDWDVKSNVEADYAASRDAHFLLKFTTDNILASFAVSSIAYFYSAYSYGGDSTKRPKLVIDYTPLGYSFGGVIG